MKLIIEIDEEVYSHVKDVENRLLTPNEEAVIRDSVANGTPLPKGHGRMGDLDALETEMVNGIHTGNYEEGYETFAHINNMDDCVDCVRYADTIIEADGGEENETNN